MSDLSVWQPGKDTEIPAFPLVLLGYQRKAVDLYLRSLFETPGTGSEVIERQADPAVPTGQLDRYQDLGREIGYLLSAVAETAAQIREEAEKDAAQWREGAISDVQNRVSDAAATAEELRKAAWEVSTQMIAQLQEMEQDAYRSIEKHSQEVIAEAESDAHRIREEARRRADGIRSNANVEALELEERSRELCDRMIDSAEQQVAAIQERVLALERHRDQLLEEIGGIRSGKAPIGVKLVDQSGGLVFPNPPDEGEEPVHVTPRHQMSGLVKVITPSKPSEESDAPPSTGGAEESEPSGSAGKSAGESPRRQDERTDDSFEDLFSALRATTVISSTPVKRTPVENPPAQAAAQVDEEQAIERREEMLLPVSNQFLRQFKRLLTEEQNRVLEGLRTGELEWGEEDVDARLQPHLQMLVEQSRQAGHRAAQQLTGRSLPKPSASAETEAGFTAQMVAEVTEAMGAEDSSDATQRARLASRTFRVWRSEKLERFVRDISESHYQQGLSESVETADSADS